MSVAAAATPSGLESHARRHLLLNQAAAVPQHYLAELQNFFSTHPDDSNFFIQRDAKYGTLTCLESACGHMKIPLSPLAGVHKGDIGSLEPYKAHIRSHSGHVAARTERVKARKSAASAASQRTSSGRFLASLDMNIKRTPSLPTSQPRPKGSSPPMNAPGVKRSQIEVLELSDSDDSDSHKSKRPKLSSPIKRPLEVVDPNIVRQRSIQPQQKDARPAHTPNAFKQSSGSSAIWSSPPRKNGTMGPSSSPTRPLEDLRKSLENRIRDYRVQIVTASRNRSPTAQATIGGLTTLLESCQRRLVDIDNQQAATQRLPAQMTQPFSAPASRPIHMEPVSVPAATNLPTTSSPPRPGASGAPASVPEPAYISNVAALGIALGLNVNTDYTDTEEQTDSDMGGYDVTDGGMLPKPLMRPIPARRQYAPTADLHSFIESASQQNFGGEETVQEALAGLGLPDINSYLPGMDVSLMAHQVIGVNWMKTREAPDAKHARGGILADAMGLGKTIQTIGVICANPSDDPGCQATLIVAPLALLEQWKNEIIEKTDTDAFNILIYHGPNRPKKTKQILEYDIVLTTYQTLANEWPDPLTEQAKKKKSKKAKVEDDFIEVDDQAAEEKKKKKFGPLMDIHWYRVVLDESQFIRNAKTRASSVVTHLIAEIRWCLTGTPLINGLRDAFGPLRFIQHRPFGDWNQFKSQLGGSDERAVQRVQHALSGVILRRTKESKLNGQPLIVLPPRHEEWISLQFEEEERSIYAFVESRAQAVFNKFLAAGTVLKNYHQLLVMLMRLRQICVHPCLIKAYESAYEVQDTRPELAKNVIEEAARLVSNDFVVLIKKRLRDTALDRIRAEKEMGAAATVEDTCSICFEPFGEDAVVAGPCAHFFCRGCIEGHINKPRNEEDARFAAHERDCPMCRQTISTTKLFDRAPFEPTNEELNISGEAEGFFDFDWVEDDSGQGGYKAKATKKRKSQGRQPAAQDDYSDLENFIVDDDEEEGDSDDDYGSSRKRKSKIKARPKANKRAIITSDEEEDEDDEAKDANYMEDSDVDDIEVAAAKAKKKAKGTGRSKLIELSDSDDNGPKKKVNDKKARVDVVHQPTMMARFLPSTKMKYMMDKLAEISEKHPDDKTMIVSQWTSALDLCSDYLNENGIRHKRFQGDMNMKQRTEAIHDFMKKSQYKVLLMSLKAGGVGLNLTRGNRVISLDLGWSNAVDQQAFDRVARLGQTKEVFIERLIIENTVEQRVKEIQDKKQALSDGALGEGKFERLRLSVGELAHLFGLGPAPQ